MIIWLASYPKSGNTWVRLIISQLLYWNDKHKKNTLEYINKISSYPRLIHYLNIPKFENLKKIENKEDIIKNWISSQDLINLDKKIKIFKTHNSLCKFEIKGVSYSFTNLENSIGAIYIVRDPRALISSIYHHLSLNSLDESVNMLLRKSTWGGLKSKPVGEFLSSWEIHYLSWKRFPKNFLLIKYEDLIKNPDEEVLRLCKFLKKFFDFNYNDEIIKKIIENTSFEKLKKYETKYGFEESVYGEKENKKKNFFRLGPNNNWNSINKELLNKIEIEFEKTMKELQYL
tara:strand:- start:88 stop:948 length:861 start_codon:yes stop_codon:yes gene_type:complete